MRTAGEYNASAVTLDLIAGWLRDPKLHGPLTVKSLERQALEQRVAARAVGPGVAELAEALDNYAALLGWTLEMRSHGAVEGPRGYQVALSMRGDPSALTDFPETGFQPRVWVMHVQPDDENQPPWVVLRCDTDSRLAALTGLVRAYITARPDSELAETVATLGITA